MVGFNKNARAQSNTQSAVDFPLSPSTNSCPPHTEPFVEGILPIDVRVTLWQMPAPVNPLLQISSTAGTHVQTALLRETTTCKANYGPFEQFACDNAERQKSNASHACTRLLACIYKVCVDTCACQFSHVSTQTCTIFSHVSTSLKAFSTNLMGCLPEAQRRRRVASSESRPRWTLQIGPAHLAAT